MHPGSIAICVKHDMYKTYVDDVNNVEAGYGPDVQAAVVECALAFNTKIVVKRKFRLSPKSGIVSNDKKLALRVQKELAEFGMHVQVCLSTRDVGVMFTAGTFRDTSNSKTRINKAKLRNARVSKIASVTRAARKLYVSGSFPQGTWGHQCVGVPPIQVLQLRRMAAASTGISSRAQRCLTSCVFICFGSRGDPWQRILKETMLLWFKLMPTYFNKCHMDLALAWSHAKQSVVQGPTPSTSDDFEHIHILWRNVTGPLSNMVACLYSIKWNPVSFSEWREPSGERWIIPTQVDYPFHKMHVVRSAQDQAASLLWQPVCKHYNGAGLEHAISFQHTMTVLHY